LRSRLDLTSRFTGHGLCIVRHLSDRVLIMYPGRSAEAAPAEEVLAHLNHPRTQALPVEVPRIQARARKLTVIAARIPSLRAAASGCHCHLRCRHAIPRRKLEVPALHKITPGRRGARCLNGA
jgi:oligopeptide/dipeptide ABC transporter ATP-binding protein